MCRVGGVTSDVQPVHTLLEMRDQSLMLSLDSALFGILERGKRLQAVGSEGKQGGDQ